MAYVLAFVAWLVLGIAIGRLFGYVVKKVQA